MKEDKLPTATELYHKGLNGEESLDSVEKCMIEFAKLHVEAALKEASEKVTLNSVEYVKYRGTIIKTENLGQEVPTEDSQVYIQADSTSILTAYPLSNIK